MFIRVKSKCANQVHYDIGDLTEVSLRYPSRKKRACNRYRFASTWVTGTARRAQDTNSLHSSGVR
jgi:hypothetical protein